MNKTVTVLVERRVKHPLYGKIVMQSRKFHAHDENNECKVGDLVEIAATRKLSKTKAFRVSNVLERAQAVYLAGHGRPLTPALSPWGAGSLEGSGGARRAVRPRPALRGEGRGKGATLLAGAGKSCHNVRLRPARTPVNGIRDGPSPTGAWPQGRSRRVQNWSP